MFSGYILKSKKVISEEGIVQFFKKVLKSTISKIFVVKNIFIYELDITNGGTKISPEINVTYSIATEDEIRGMDENQYGYDERAKQYSLNGIKNGDICILAFSEEKLIGYILHMKESMELSEGHLIGIPQWRSYLYKGLVVEEFRGKRVLSGLINHQIEILRSIGKTSLVYTVSKKNVPSNKATKKMGFNRIGRIIQLRILGFKYDYISRKDLYYIKGKNL